MSWQRILEPQILVFMIPIVAMLMPVVAIFMKGIVTVTKLIIRHRERIAMIERGLDPDRQQGEDG